MPTRRALQLDFVTFALVCLLFSLVVSASLVNITVDDSEFNNGVPRITYTPLNSWHIGEDCLTCTAHPNPDEAFAGTWHDSTFLRGADEHDIKTASLEFNGSAIYVYCITTGSYIKPLGNSEMSFFIDGDLVGSLSQTANGNTNYSFNVLVYSNDSMPAGVHSFTMRNGLVGGLESLLLLDYIIYSQDSDAPVQTVSPVHTTPVDSSPLPNTSSSSPSTISLPPLSATSASLSTNSATSSPAGSSPTYHVPSFLSASSQLLPRATNPTQLESSSSHTRTVIIAATVASSVVFIASIIAFFLYRRKRLTHPYPYAPPTEPNIAEDPSSSGWVEDAFGRREGGGVEHPSLALTQGVPLDLRGDPSTRAAGKSKRERNLQDKDPVAATGRIDPTSLWDEPQQPPMPPGNTRQGSSESVVAAEMAKTSRSRRHPYAAHTPEPDIDPLERRIAEEQPHEPELPFSPSTVPLLSAPTPLSASLSTPASADSLGFVYPPTRPPPARQRSGSRPLPVRPLLESQGHAAQVRRQNSAATSQSLYSPTGEELPPSYDASRAPHIRR